MHAIIIGAGPAGLAAALALHHQQSHSRPIRVTILERRQQQTSTTLGLGGAINLTPLAMRYLDALGVGPRLRPLGVRVSPGIAILSHRTGALLGRLWPGVDALRVLRRDLVGAMVETVKEAALGGGGGGGIEVRYGVDVRGIEESAEGRSVKVRFIVAGVDGGGGGGGNGEEQVIEADFLLGCDGIHSFVRSSFVDPERKKTYSGRASAYGYVTVSGEPGDAGIVAADGSRAVEVSTLISGQRGSLLVSFFEPSLSKLYLATVIAQPEGPDGMDGRQATGEDKEAVKRDFMSRFRGGGLAGLEDVVRRCEEWVSFPIYMIPPGGVWSRGRVLLLGDAAHAMPPQGESTGVAIEDGVLLAHVFSRRDTRSVAQMFADYEGLRRPVINKTYDETLYRWGKVGDRGWFAAVVMDWFTMLYIWIMNSWSRDNFGRDVRELVLPA
ncbi:hypothetical protein C8A03DRAFT_17209 [Achaetomium macrosporum]|uniref:FAD-binding domain-containing protein n=1 Tax=Achaetomium macrosporum TaxID=79813 RepID=A0AAN7C642_9PEZI|nr:hypothetical protein C8A03DRAFT_17209 [Achaetomium macrosporum]